MTAKGPLVYRQSGWTRATHWIWAVSLFFLLLSGLQIFNAFPKLQWGLQSGFDYDNAFLEIGAQEVDGRVQGYVDLLGRRFDTTGILGLHGDVVQAFPPALTIPSTRNLSFGRVVHFFFAWVLAGTLIVWLVASGVNGHLRRDLVPTGADLRALPGDIADHARLRFHRTPRYNVLQKLAYGGVLFGLFPLIILTGLCMSPSVNALAPWLLDVFGGRQSARTLHFLSMLGLVGFFVIHIGMILAAGPLNELRSIITGWYRIDADKGDAR